MSGPEYDPRQLVADVLQLLRERGLDPQLTEQAKVQAGYQAAKLLVSMRISPVATSHPQGQQASPDRPARLRVVR